MNGVDILKKTIAAIALTMFLFTGCNNLSSDKEIIKENNTSAIEVQGEDQPPAEEKQLSLEQLSALEVDESGEVMVLMYHNIGTEEAEWTRTPQNFRKDLETLYEKGFRTISLEKYSNGEIATEAGFTPVVLTFDDGNENNFRYIEKNGEKIIDPECAVGVLEEFKKDYPDFNTTASFFLNSSVFGKSEEAKQKLEFLIENGYSVGNHTQNHLNLKTADALSIQKEISSLKKMHETTYPEMDINTLALPFGAKPPADLYNLTYEGSFEGISYENIAVLLVGWDPYLSPYDKDFDFSNIRRVRASETNVDGVGLYDWLAAYEKGSKQRYISDGNPMTIAIPSPKEDLIDIEKFSDKILIDY